MSILIKKEVVSVGEFDGNIGEMCLINLLFQHELQSVNKEPTCFKNADSPSCIDFMLTKSPGSFFKTDFIYSIIRF